MVGFQNKKQTNAGWGGGGAGLGGVAPALPDPPLGRAAARASDPAPRAPRSVLKRLGSVVPGGVGFRMRKEREGDPGRKVVAALV